MPITNRLLQRFRTQHVTGDPLARLTAAQAAALDEEVERYGKFLGVPVTLR